MQRNKFLMVLFILALGLMACATPTVASEFLQKTANVDTSAEIPVTGGQAFELCGGPVIPAINPDYEQAIVEKTNEIRMQNGLPPLKYSVNLSSSARYHAADMAVNNYFDHNSLHNVNGQMTQNCDTWNRIERYYTNWEALGENIAAGQRTPDSAMDGWWNSPEHRQNMLSDSYWEIGVGFYEGKGEYRYYWDQNFGRQDGVFPLIIDAEKAQTNTSKVSLYIYGRFNQMRLRNDQGAWSSWQPFKTSFNWTLPDTPGKHTVEAELRGQDGHATSSDSITLAP